MNFLWILLSGSLDVIRIYHKVIKMPCLKDHDHFLDAFITKNTNSNFQC